MLYESSHSFNFFVCLDLTPNFVYTECCLKDAVYDLIFVFLSTLFAILLVGHFGKLGHFAWQQPFKYYVFPYIYVLIHILFWLFLVALTT